MADMQDPAFGAFAVTPDDNASLTGVRSLYIGGSGNIAVVTRGRTTAVTFTAVPAGTILPVQAVKVNSTNTTATAIVALT